MLNTRSMLLEAAASMFAVTPASAGWIKTHEGLWTYEKNGVRVRNNWVEENGSWYFFDWRGYMLSDTTKTIGGVEYKFDGSGKRVDPTAQIKTVERSKTFADNNVGYKIEVPAGAELVRAEGADKPCHMIKYKGMEIGLTYADMDAKEDPERYVNQVLDRLTEENPEYSYIGATEGLKRGDYIFTSYGYVNDENQDIMNVYISHNKERSQLFVIYANIKPDSHMNLALILRTLRNTAQGR